MHSFGFLLEITCKPAASEVDVGNGYLSLSSGTDSSFGAEYVIVCNESTNLTGATPNNPGDVVTCGEDGRWELGTAYCLGESNIIIIIKQLEVIFNFKS